MKNTEDHSMIRAQILSICDSHGYHWDGVQKKFYIEVDAVGRSALHGIITQVRDRLRKQFNVGLVSPWSDDPLEFLEPYRTLDSLVEAVNKRLALDDQKGAGE